MVFMDKTGFVMIGIISSLMHEFGHIAAVKLKGYKVNGINLGCVSADIFLKYDNFEDKLEILLSGSLTNFLISIIFKVLYFYFEYDVFRVIYFQNVCIGVLNLLPVADLDGGCIFLLLLSKKKDISSALKILNMVSVIFLIPIFAIGIWIFAISEDNFSLLVLGVYLTICIFVKKL